MAVKLYRNYTVVVQDSVSYEPNNDLQLFLYEGKLELKVDPLFGRQAVFQYGTTVLAQAAKDQYGVDATALIADETTRPGEYDFVGLDLDATTSGYAGETLYSVVARPAGDLDFSRALIIVENTDISDPNLKQMVRFAVGSAGSIGDNLYFAGGTVVFQQYTVAGITNNESVQHLKLLNLPEIITDLAESPDAVPAYSVGQKLIPRFNVYYGNTDGYVYNCIVWKGVPAYKTSDGSWVIKLQADEYNTRRTLEFGTLPGEFQLNAIYPNFTVSIDVTALNIHVRNFSETPATTIPTINASAERVCVHTFMDGSGNRVVGVGEFNYSSASEKPAYNLDVKGSLGMRVRVGSRSMLGLASDARIGYDTAQTYFGSSFGLLSMYLQGVPKIVATPTTLLQGVNCSLYPRMSMSSSYVKMEGSAYTSLEISSANDIIGLVNNTGASASVKVLDLKLASQRMGYDLDGSNPVFFGASSGSIVVSHQSQIKFLATGSTTTVAVNTSAYPKFYATALEMQLALSSLSYMTFLANSGLPKVSLFVQDNSGATESFRALSGSGVLIPSKTSVGYNIDTKYWATFDTSGMIFYNTAAIKVLALTSSGGVMSSNITDTTKPTLQVESTNSYVKGTASTYLQATSSDQLCMNVLIVGTSKRALSLDGTDARFGYHVNDSSGIYFSTTPSSVSIVHSGQTVFNRGATNTVVQSGSGGSSVTLAPSSYTVSIGASTVINASTTETYVYSPVGTSPIYLKMGDYGFEKIRFQCQTFNSPYAYVGMGYWNPGTGISYNYLKIPFSTTDMSLGAHPQIYGAVYIRKNSLGQYYLAVGTDAASPTTQRFVFLNLTAIPA